MTNPAQANTEVEPHGISASQISHSIGLARIILICGLAFLHYEIFPNSTVNPFEGLDLHEHRIPTWINSFVVFFFHSAVPLLSAISGWLFFTFKPQDAWSAIFRRMRGRVTSVYLPMCAWNALYLVLVYSAFRLNPTSPAFSHATRFGIDFFKATPMNYINSVFAVTGAPIGFQFWFVRDLFVTALLAPVWWLLISRVPWVGAAALGVMWLLGWNLYIFLRLDVPFFFYLGALLHQKKMFIAVPLRTTILAVSCFSILAALRASATTLVSFPNHVDPYWLDVATRTMRIFGVIGCWGVIYRLAATSPGMALSRYGGLAFFVYSAHWPLLSIIKVALWRVMHGESDFSMLTNYVLSVTLTIAMCVLLALTLAHYTPRFFSLMNGGRLLGQNKNQRPETTSTKPAGLSRPEFSAG